MSIVDLILQRIDNLAFAREQRLQQLFGQPAREITYLNNAESKRKPALFGSDPYSGPFEDYAGEPRIRGVGSVPRPDKPENVSGFVENWQPVEGVPKMPSHGRALDYSHNTDQRTVVSFQGEVSEKWDGQIRSHEPKKSLETSRPTQKTIGDKIGEEMRKTESYWFIG